MNKTQMLLNEIKNNEMMTLEEIQVFAEANEIKTYKGLVTRAKNQQMLIEEEGQIKILPKGIEYITYNPKNNTKKAKEKRKQVQRTREQECYDLQQELINIFNTDKLKMNTLKKNRIVQICNRMIKLDEQAINTNKSDEE